MKTYIFNIGGKTDGKAADVNLLGGKGANLAEMAKLGLPVPSGVTIPTDLCIEYLALDAKYRYSYLKELVTDHVMPHLKTIEKEFGYMPLFSVRSGARVSMPGMMDTVLNVGLSSTNLVEWGLRLNTRAALDSFRRGIQMTGTTARDHPAGIYEGTLTRWRKEAGVKTDAELTHEHLGQLVDEYIKIYETIEGEKYPSDLVDHLILCIDAVFTSWNTERAIYYRKMNDYPDDWGTAVNVQAMVFGNMNDGSCSGVLFTRNPSTGEPKLTGEYLINAQGEDVVAGTRTPETLDHMHGWSHDGCYEELVCWAENLEAHYRDMQDIEFTVQDGKLWILQTRNAKRSAKAKFRVAFDLREEKAIDTKTMRSRITGADFDALTSTQIDPSFKGTPNHTGLGAGGSLVCGRVALTSDAAIKLSKLNDDVILVRHETTPDDIAGMDASDGILTTTGGATSHAAVVARGMNKVCVVGCSELNVSGLNNCDWVTINGATGEVWLEAVPLVRGKMDSYARAILKECVEEDEPLVVVGTDWQDNNGILIFPLADFDTGVEAAVAVKAILEDGGDLIKVVLDMTPPAAEWEEADIILLGMTAQTGGSATTRQYTHLQGMAKTLALTFDHKFYVVARGELPDPTTPNLTRIDHKDMVFGRKSQLAHIYFGG